MKRPKSCQNYKRKKEINRNNNTQSKYHQKTNNTTNGSQLFSITRRPLSSKPKLRDLSNSNLDYSIKNQASISQVNSNYNNIMEKYQGIQHVESF